MARYPSPENVEIQPQARTFILFALTLAYPMFGAGFEFALAVPCLWLLAVGFFSGSGDGPISRPLLLLSCDDFELAGNMLPDNCRR